MPLLLSPLEMPDGLVRIIPLKAFGERCESAWACLARAVDFCLGFVFCKFCDEEAVAFVSVRVESLALF